MPTTTRMPKAGWDDSTRGARVTIEIDEGRSVTFVAGGQKRRELGDGFAMVNGRVILADGTRLWALLTLCEPDSCELWDWGVFLPDGELAYRSDFDDPTAFYKAIGKTSEQEVYPLSYRYDVLVDCLYDHHVGKGGWSIQNAHEAEEAALAKLAEIAPLYHMLRGQLGGEPPTQPEEKVGKPCWQDVRAQLKNLCHQGRTYTSQRKLARELGYKDNLIRKAIENSEELQLWVAASKSPLPVPRATSLSDPVADSLKSCASDPADQILDREEVDNVMERIKERAKPEELTELAAKSPEERLELARLFNAQNLDDAQTIVYKKA